jgi:hypothetical protein
MLLQEKAHGEKFVLSLLHPTGWQSARQRRADICASHIEQVRQGLGMVAVAREARFQVIHVLRQRTFNEFRRERLLPHLALSSSARVR